MPELKKDLSDAQLERYGRHVMLDALGVKGQGKLLDSCALVVGAGGLGCPAALYLASCGVGRIKIVDDDTVELSNLQRQTLYRDSDIGMDKVVVAAKQLSSINPDVRVDAVNARADESNLPSLCENVQVVLDCSDNFKTRHAVNRFCQQNNIDLVTGAAEQFDGQVIVLPFSEAKSPCYNCLFSAQSDVPDSTPCALLGVFAPLTGLIGSLMAGEAIRLITDMEPEGLKWRMLAFDALEQRTFTAKIKKEPSCPICQGG